jgi:hypothetical protein
MVGFHPIDYHGRTMMDAASGSHMGRYSYNILSDQVAFVHRLFLNVPTPQGTRCDNVALSLKISSLTKQPPMAMYTGGAHAVMAGRALSSLTYLRHAKKVQQKRLQQSVECVESLMELLHINIDTAANGGLPTEQMTFVGGG